MTYTELGEEYGKIVKDLERRLDESPDGEEIAQLAFDCDRLTTALYDPSRRLHVFIEALHRLGCEFHEWNYTGIQPPNEAEF